MSEQQPDSQGTLEPYPCSQIIYRPITDEDWWRPGRTGVKKQAFYRRRKFDTKGLSVNPHPSDSYKYLTREFFGFVKLHVGRLRDIGLDVVPDRPDHANITGIPTRDEDRDKAVQIAELLAEKYARPVTEDELKGLLQQRPPAE